MAHTDIEALQLYFNRLRPVYPLMFNLAHAITGNCDQAEYCLQSAMLNCWASGGDSASMHGFRESLRNEVVHAGWKLKDTAQKQAEFDWDGLQSLPENAGALQNMIVQESPELRRMIALRWGCGLSARRISKIVNCDASRTATLLRRFESRARRKLTEAERRRFDARITQAVRTMLAIPAAQMPEIGGMFRTFQAEAAAVNPNVHLPLRVLRIVLSIVFALFCIIAFWLAAVLIQPPVLETPASPAVERHIEQ